MRRYELYRWHQAREFLTLLPPAGLRALYREAISAPEDPNRSDPLEMVAGLVAARLPLPPFHVWYQDVCRHPEAHLDEAWMAEGPAGPAVPLALWSRSERLSGGPWDVELVVHRAVTGWRGSLTFSRPHDAGRWRTAAIFREPSVEALVERFEELDRVALEAFLRSVLP